MKGDPSMRKNMINGNTWLDVISFSCLVCGQQQELAPFQVFASINNLNSVYSSNKTEIFNKWHKGGELHQSWGSQENDLFIWSVWISLPEYLAGWMSMGPLQTQSFLLGNVVSGDGLMSH